MTVVVTENQVKNREEYLKLAVAFVNDARMDKGCSSMEVCINPEKDDSVIFVSKWVKKEDFMNHTEGAAFAKHIPEMAPYYVSGTDTFLEVVS